MLDERVAQQRCPTSGGEPQQAAPRGMMSVPDAIVQWMRSQCVARTDEALQRQFGISYNTWRRIDAGQPIRLSVALRLVARAHAS